MSDAQSATVESLRTEVQRLQQQVAELTAREQQFAELDAFVEPLFNAVPYSIAVVDVYEDGTTRHIRANNASHRMFGIGGAEPATARPAFDASTWGEVQNRLIACRDTGKPLEFEEQLRLSDRTVWTQAIYTPAPRPNSSVTRVIITSFDITARKLREQEERERQEAIILHQAATLTEISTPLLAITEDTVVMPLVGAMDSQRVRHMMEVLLSGVAAARASNVILDITGVAVVDTQVANAFVQASQALSLLGARVIITGIRPEVAQILVSLGVELGNIVTRSSLQSGIAYTMRS